MALIECLRALSSLITLSIQKCGLDCRPLLIAMRYHEDEHSTLLPELQHFTLSVDGELFSGEPSMDMVESRWFNQPSLDGVFC
jgi:hypothetical protein